MGVSYIMVAYGVVTYPDVAVSSARVSYVDVGAGGGRRLYGWVTYGAVWCLEMWRRTHR